MSHTPEPTLTRYSTKHPFEKWEQVRLDYVMGRGTLRWCSLRHQIPYQTVCSRAKGEMWNRQREQWFLEKRLREQVPQVAALINPPTYEGQGPPPPIAPLSADYFLHHHNRYALRLNSLDEELSEVFNLLRKDRHAKPKDKLSVTDRTALMRAAKEYIELTRTILGIPNVKPISRDPADAKPRRHKTSNPIDITPTPVKESAPPSPSPDPLPLPH